LFEESYASGHPDSGFYIGRCDPCDAVVRHVTADGNVVGFQGTNASGNLFIVESEWRGNRVGIQPNSDTEEGNLPQHDATIVGNVVADNDNPATPPSDTGEFGYGIALGGASRDVVERNLVIGNANTGIALLGDNKGFLASDNRVAGNVLRDNGVDLEYLSPTGDGRGNCFEGNVLTTSFPAEIERLLPCSGATGGIPPATARQRVEIPQGVGYQDLPPPPAEPNLPNAGTAPGRPATGMPTLDVASISVPSAP
jgi:parallel beta-helix repeat protein